MPERVAIIGAGVSGLTCGVLCAEQGWRVAIFAEAVAQNTTSGAAAAIWFPYDAAPAERVTGWALETYRTLFDLTHEPQSGVFMLELRQCSRAAAMQIPPWARTLGATALPAGVFPAGLRLTVPVIDTTVYLDYLVRRFIARGGVIHRGVRVTTFEEVDSDFDLVINCAGIGARELARDTELEPHRGQVAIVPKIDGLDYAIACDEAPLTYAIPRPNDCVFGGTNELSDNLAIEPEATARMVAECARVLNIDPPPVLAERVGLRPFRKSGVRLERARLRDGRAVIHNYGHGGSGFTLSWGCARAVLRASSADSSPLRGRDSSG